MNIIEVKNMIKNTNKSKNFMKWKQIKGEVNRTEKKNKNVTSKRQEWVIKSTQHEKQNRLTAI